MHSLVGQLQRRSGIGKYADRLTQIA